MPFHVPETARWNEHPFPEYHSTADDGNNGAFLVESVEPGWRLLIVASDQDGWEHVSIHAERPNKVRTPTWKEMCQVKGLFWDDGDIVMQLHPRLDEYVNRHPHTLHLWRPTDQAIPTPPLFMV